MSALMVGIVVVAAFSGILDVSIQIRRYNFHDGAAASSDDVDTA